MKRLRQKVNSCILRVKARIKLGQLLRNIPKEGRRVFMLATPTHGNLGDQAIVYAEKKMLTNYFEPKSIIEVANEFYLLFPKVIQRVVDEEDLIVIDGGGNLGTLWKNEDGKITDIISRFYKNDIIIFPQTCYYENNDESRRRIEKNRRVYAKAKKLKVMLRDWASYQFFLSSFQGTKVYYGPDIVLSLQVPMIERDRNGALFCYRGDIEERRENDSLKNRIQQALVNRGYRIQETSMCVDDSIGEKNREQRLREKLHEFASAEIVATDRLHAMLFCAITGTPCIAMDNVSNKVSGAYEWIKGLP